MRSNAIVLAVLALMLAVIIGSGCMGNTSPTPVPSAVDLQKKGFDEYINGNYSVALDLYNQSLAADPKYTRSWIEKGNVLVKLNRSSEAILSYDSALALENDLAIVWNSRGEALMATGNYSGAQESFDKAIGIAPEYAAAKENRDLALKKLQGEKTLGQA
jgi:tetratricopeptide (TPR) repeat protein